MKIFGNTVFTFSKKQQTYIDVPSERSDSSVKMSNEENSIALSFEVCDTTEKMEQQTASTIELFCGVGKQFSYAGCDYVIFFYTRKILCGLLRVL